MPKSDRKVLNFILGCRADNPKRPVYLGYEKLGERLGYCGKTIQRSIGRLIQRGWISLKPHSYDGNEYFVHPIFDDLSIRRWLGCFMPSLYKHIVYFSLSLSMLSSAQHNIHTETVHPNLVVKREIYISVPSVLSDCIGKVRVRARGEYGSGTDFSKKGREMSLEFVKSHVKAISLTPWGRENIACFPTAAIKHAEAKFKTAGSVRDPYALYKSFCLEYCRINKLRVDFRSVDEKRSQHPELSQAEYITSLPKSYAVAQNLPKKDDDSQPTYSKPEVLSIERTPYKPQDISGVDPVANVKTAAHSERAAGRELNEFMKIMIGESEYRPEKKTETQSSVHLFGFKKPTVTVPMPEEMKIKENNNGSIPPVVPAVPGFTPLDVEEMAIINRILDHHDMVTTWVDSGATILGYCADLMTQGAQHPLAKDRSFWDGMKHVCRVIDQELAKGAQVFIRVPPEFDTELVEVDESPLEPIDVFILPG